MAMARPALCWAPHDSGTRNQCARAARPRRFLYYLSYIKVAVAMAMYLPQVLLNHERRSTAGFSVEQARRAPLRTAPPLQPASGRSNAGGQAAAKLSSLAMC
jgi:hypothetical protein